MKKKTVFALLFITIIISSFCLSCSNNSSIEKYKVHYSTDNNGYIDNNSFQTVPCGGSSNMVEAIPQEGYLFGGWSDGILSNPRIDKNIHCNISVYAKFVPKVKTYAYNYNGATSNNKQQNITLLYEKLSDTKFVIPQKDNYYFCGWYLEPEFTTKISDENGKLYYGYGVFYSESNYLYAKWKNKSNMQNNSVFPILMIFVDEISAVLSTNHASEKVECVCNEFDINIEYKMTLVERKICEMLVYKFLDYLNGIFKNKVKFEIDTYFTTSPILIDSFSSGCTASGIYSYYVYADDIPEIGFALGKYRSVITTFGINDYDFLLIGGNTATEKYASIHLESILSGLIENQIQFDELLNHNNIDWGAIMDLYAHEFTHTVESGLNLTVNYHSILNHYSNMGVSSIDATKLYLLSDAKINGQNIGIPSYYWEGKITITLNYLAGNGGYLVNGDNFNYHHKKDSLIQTIFFGQNSVPVKAIPNDGYRFVKWSDGLLTDIRRELNVISRINVMAIFEKL